MLKYFHLKFLIGRIKSTRRIIYSWIRKRKNKKLDKKWTTTFMNPTIYDKFKAIAHFGERNIIILLSILYIFHQRVMQIIWKNYREFFLLCKLTHIKIITTSRTKKNFVACHEIPSNNLLEDK